MTTVASLHVNARALNRVDKANQRGDGQPVRSDEPAVQPEVRPAMRRGDNHQQAHPAESVTQAGIEIRPSRFHG